VEVEAAACGLPLFLTRHHGSEMILEDRINGRWLDFDAAAIATVLDSFISGAWRPERVHVKGALDAGTYAERLLREIDPTASTQPAESTIVRDRKLLPSHP